MPIRKLRADDMSPLISLLDELNVALHEQQKLNSSTILEHFTEMERFPELYANLVYEEDGKILGFLSIVFYRSVYHNKGTALINELVVTARHRGAGIGGRLLEYGVQLAKRQGMDEIEVGVMKENAEAIEFYKRHGIAEEYLLLGLEFK